MATVAKRRFGLGATDGVDVAPDGDDLPILASRGEFSAHSVAETLAGMTEDDQVTDVPILTGGVGHETCGAFYGRSFIPQIPPDFTIVPVSRTIGGERVVDEFVVRFPHTVRMNWMLPGVAPTGRPVAVPKIAVVPVRDGKVASQHIDWDQVSVLGQLGLLEATALPVAGLGGAEAGGAALAPPCAGSRRRRCFRAVRLIGEGWGRPRTWEARRCGVSGLLLMRGAAVSRGGAC